MPCAYFWSQNKTVYLNWDMARREGPGTAALKAATWLRKRNLPHSHWGLDRWSSGKWYTPVAVTVAIHTMMRQASRADRHSLDQQSSWGILPNWSALGAVQTLHWMCVCAARYISVKWSVCNCQYVRRSFFLNTSYVTCHMLCVWHVRRWAGMQPACPYMSLIHAVQCQWV